MKNFLFLLLFAIPAYSLTSPSKTIMAREDSAEVLLNNALTQAKIENKLVFLRFSETWCSYCTRMQNILDRPNMQRILGKELIDLKIDLTNTPGARPIYKKYTHEVGGVPWFAFLDTAGAAAATSVGPEGNIGCPATDGEIIFFTGELKRTTKLSDSELEEVAYEFKHP